MPNFDPAQELPADATVQTVPLSLPNQFGAVVAGAPSNPDISPQGNPGDVVINPAAIVDPRLRAAYIAAHPPVDPAAPPALGLPSPPADVPAAPGGVPVVAPVAAPLPPGKAGGGGGASATGLPPGSADLQKTIQEGTRDEASALKNVGETQDYNAQQTSDAMAAREDLRRQQAADLAAEQLYVRERQTKLYAEDQANLDRAKNATIPEFYESREGQLVGAAITVGLSGAAGALLGTTHNTALEAINHNIDSYYGREKDRIDNMYKYAESKGRLDDSLRTQYASELTDLMQVHAYTLQSAAERIEQVQAESKGRLDQANTQYMASQLKAQAAKELAAARGLDINIYDSKTKRIEANAAATRAAAEKTKANAEGSEKADEAAFRTYVTSPHGKQAQETTRRVDALRSASEGIDQARSVGEVTAQIDKAIAADAGQGTRGVSLGQLHTILPKLVSATGEISNTVSQNWDGSAGKEFRSAAKRLVDTARVGRESQYKREADDLEKNVALTPHAKKNPDFAKSSRMQLYPDLPAAAAPAAAAPAKSVPIGARATSGGKPIVMTAQGWQPG